MAETPGSIGDALAAASAVPTQGGRSDLLTDILDSLPGSVVGPVGHVPSGWRAKDGVVGRTVIDATGDADEG